jgi:hypothetical protein
MDQEVVGISCDENSLSIESTPERGFSLFFITFEGTLSMKQRDNQTKRYKMSFMVEGTVHNDENQQVKESTVTVKATKMSL